MRRMATKGATPAIAGVQAAARALLVASMFWLCGCVVVPVPMSTRTRDVSRKPQTLDFSFLKPGLTTREEVAKNLAAIDTHVQPAGFFWGRWERSKWAFGAAVIPDYASANALGGRIWGGQNVLVAFDQENIVSRWSIVADAKLHRQLDLLDNLPKSTPDLASTIHEVVLLPVSNDVNAIHTGNLTLSAELLQCSDVEAQRTNLKKITPAISGGPDPDAAYIWITIHLRKRTSGKQRVKGLTLGVDPQTLLLLRRYVKRSKSPDTPRVITADTNRENLNREFK